MQKSTSATGSWLVAAHPAWSTIKSIGRLESIRTVGETVTTEQR
jgi:hypothetical protein